MGKKIALWITGIFGAAFGKIFGIFLISMIPVIELRGAIPVAFALGMPWYTAFIVAVIGNLLPIPFILWLCDKVFIFMKKHNILKNFVIKMEEKAHRSSDKVTKYKFWGLAIFVGIPLPGTGAWTGSLIASVIKMDKKKAILSITIGVLIAAIIMTILTYGLLGAIIK